MAGKDCKKTRKMFVNNRNILGDPVRKPNRFISTLCRHFYFYFDYRQIQSRFISHVSYFLFLPDIQQIKLFVSNQA